MTGKLVWNKSQAQILEGLGVQPGGEVQKLIDNAVIRYCEPYTPFDTGNLSRSPNTASNIGSGEITYPGPYAHYQYYGEVYGPNIPVMQGGEVVGFFSPPNQTKNPTGEKLNYSKSQEKNGPLAGSFWFARAMADHKDDILQEAQDYANKHR